MNYLTQYQKIIEMCSDGGWHCQVEFWNMFIRSPHKRRSEIERQGRYRFESSPCEHGYPKVRDYRMTENPKLSREEEEKELLTAATQ